MKLLIMILYLNMISHVVIGNVELDNVSKIEINESITELSNSAKITIAKAYKRLEDKSILDNIHVGDRVEARLGYYSNEDKDIAVEFVGYVSEIESDYPLIIHCDDEMYPLKQNNIVKSYKSATLKQLLSDIVGKDMKISCPEVNLGK